MRLLLCSLVTFLVIGAVQSDSYQCYDCGGNSKFECKKPGKMTCDTDSQSCVKIIYRDGYIKRVRVFVV